LHTQKHYLVNNFTAIKQQLENEIAKIRRKADVQIAVINQKLKAQTASMTANLNDTDAQIDILYESEMKPNTQLSMESERNQSAMMSTLCTKSAHLFLLFRHSRDGSSWISPSFYTSHCFQRLSTSWTMFQV